MEGGVHPSVERSAHARYETQCIRNLSTKDSRGLSIAGSLVFGQYRSRDSVGCVAEASTSACCRMRYDELLDQRQARCVMAGFGAGRYFDYLQLRGPGPWGGKRYW